MSDPKDQLRRQLDTVWRMASSGFDTLREVVVRSSQAGRLRVDLALLARERRELLASIGEQVVALVDENGLEIPEEVRQLYDRVRDIDARMRADSVKQDSAFGARRGNEPEAGTWDDDPNDPDEHADAADDLDAAHARKGETR